MFKKKNEGPQNDAFLESNTITTREANCESAHSSTATCIRLTLKEWTGEMSVPTPVSIHNVIGCGLRRMRRRTASHSHSVAVNLSIVTLPRQEALSRDHHKGKVLTLRAGRLEVALPPGNTAQLLTLEMMLLCAEPCRRVSCKMQNAFTEENVAIRLENNDLFQTSAFLFN